MSIRNVIFDLDGTLVDSLPGIAWSVEAALAECELPPRFSDIRPLLGPPVRDILAKVSDVTDALTLDALQSAFRRSYDSHGWRKTVLVGHVEAMLRALLDAGAHLWVVTNKPSFSTRLILGEVGIADCFREVICPDSRQPPFASKTEMIADLVIRRKLDAAATVMVGDTAEDCQAAVVAGLTCLMVSHGYGEKTGRELPEGCAPLSSWDELIARVILKK
jgi:phosphoglycolate phosphatase